MADVSWLLASAWLAVATPADSVTIRARQTADAAEIVIEWSAPVVYTSTIDGRELSLRFARALTLDTAIELDKILPEWLDAVATGFDSLLIRSRRDTSYTVRAEGALVVVELRGVPTPLTESADDQQADLRLDLLRAQLLVAEGHWTRADRVLATAVARHPRATDVINARREIRREHAGRTRLDVDVKRVEGRQEERTARVTAHALVAGYTQVGGAIENNHAILDGHVFERQRAEVYLQRDFDSGGELRVSAFGTRVTVGGAVHYVHTDSSGKTRVALEYRRPFWEFVESLAGNGTRDRLEIRREHRFGSRVSVRAGGVFNQYGLGTANALVQSTGLDAAVNVTLVTANPGVALEYAVDVESGRFIQPGTIPLANREVHAGNVTVRQRLSRLGSAEASVGYAFDRLGGRSPFIAARAGREGASRLGVEMWFDRRLQSIATSQVVSRLGANIHWRFD